jgi:DNA polymerase IV
MPLLPFQPPHPPGSTSWRQPSSRPPPGSSQSNGYYAIARGIDHRPVQADRQRKSIGAEDTFARDLFGFEEMRVELQLLVDKLWSWCERSGVRGRTVTLKVKYADFHQITRSRSLAEVVADRSTLEQVSLGLLAPLLPVDKGVRLLGVTLSALGTAEQASQSLPQLTLAL